MNDRSSLRNRAARTATAIGAAALLVTGAAWQGMAAGPEPLATVTTPIANAIAAGRDSYSDIVSVVAPAVVTIRVEGKASAAPAQFQVPDDEFFRRFFGNPGDQNRPGQRRQQQQPRKTRGLGSGVIVTTDGYILTNNHVVEGAESIHVETTDGRTATAKIVGTDKPSDLALLKVNQSNLHAVALGNSDGVQVGDVVLAVGNPLGVGQTVTMGIISAKGRSTGAGSGGGYEDFLQTDAPINHGNSGGALVNTKGELVGINSQIVSNSDGNIGIGFAIPSNMAKNVMEQLRTNGKVTRAQLGVTVQAVTSDMAASLGLKEVSGVVISNVASGSAADHAGLKRGDVIESFNGQAVHDTNTLRNRVAAAGPGSTAKVTVVRDGETKQMSVKLDEASPAKVAARDSDSDENDKSALGVTVAPLTPELASRLGAPKDTRGVVVENVNPDGRAADAGIQAGDIIEEVNRQPVQSVDELRAAVGKQTDRPLLLLVSRDGSSIFVTVPMA